MTPSGRPSRSTAPASGADRARGREARRAHAGLEGDVRARARSRCPAASPRSYQVRDPWPIYLTTARARGLGRRRAPSTSTSTTASAAMAQGHAHPAITRAVTRARARSARTSPRRPRTASPSRRSWPGASGLPKWRYTNSGSEATMDAIRIARAAHRPRRRDEDLRLVPRPPRRGDGLDRRRRTTGSATATTRLAPVRRRDPAARSST